MKIFLLLTSVFVSSSYAFSQQNLHTKTILESSHTKLFFGIPTFGPGKKTGNEGGEMSSDEPKKQIGLSGLFQLITAGMGSPFLGDFEGVEEGTGKLLFSLEANNLVDENGKSKQTSMPYFESGWVDEEEEKTKKEKTRFKLW